MVASLGAFDVLEPYTVKVVRTVLRGLGGSDAARLPCAVNVGRGPFDCYWACENALAERLLRW